MILYILEAMQKRGNQKIKYMGITLQQLPLQTILNASIQAVGNYIVKVRIEETHVSCYLPKSLFKEPKKFSKIQINTNNLSDIEVKVKE